MQLKLIRHLWGLDDPLGTIPRIRSAGYEGVEGVPPLPEDEERFRRTLADSKMAFVATVSTRGDSVAEHIRSFEEQLWRARNFAPLLAACHGGSDRWTPEECRQFYSAVLPIEREAGLPVAHETHRGRCLFNPWASAALLDDFPALQLCCDFSHWVVVCERLLGDIPNIITQCAQRCLHVHGRVGYEEGPQVADPRAAQWRRHVEAHEAWWDEIWQAQAAGGMAISTFTPEFGPPPYMQTFPGTGVPLADTWDIANWMARREAQRFELIFSAA